VVIGICGSTRLVGFSGFEKGDLLCQVLSDSLERAGSNVGESRSPAALVTSTWRRMRSAIQSRARSETRSQASGSRNHPGRAGVSPGRDGSRLGSHTEQGAVRGIRAWLALSQSILSPGVLPLGELNRAERQARTGAPRSPGLRHSRRGCAACEVRPTHVRNSLPEGWCQRALHDRSFR